MMEMLNISGQVVFHPQGHGMNHHMLSDRLGTFEYDNGSRIVTLTNNMNTKL